jgi:hypothetical protein
MTQTGVYNLYSCCSPETMVAEKILECSWAIAESIYYQDYKS